MQYTLFKPSFLLRNFIRFYWTFETDCDNGSTFLHESVASASSKLVFQYRGDMGLTGSPSGSRTGMVASIQAQTRHASTFISAGPVGIFGVYFYPGALSLLLSMPAHELNNQNILLASMKGISADQLEEDVILATSTIERIDIVNAFFEARLAGISKPDLQIFTSIQAIATSMASLLFRN